MKVRMAAILAAFLFAVSATGASAYTEQDVAGGGAISGKITFSGKAPDPVKIPIEKNPEVCGTGFREIQEVTVDGSGGLQHAVVYIDKIEAGKKWPKPDKGWELHQKTCRFIPWIQVIQDKTDLTVVSEDPVLHNIHTYELVPAGTNTVRVTMFNEAQPTQGYTFTKNIRMRKGNSVKVECDAHNFMHAYMMALKNPYYAITAADGSFTVDNIPPGTYEVTVWHSLLGSVTKTVEVKGGAKAALAHQYSK